MPHGAYVLRREFVWNIRLSPSTLGDVTLTFVFDCSFYKTSFVQRIQSELVTVFCSSCGVFDRAGQFLISPFCAFLAFLADGIVIVSACSIDHLFGIVIALFWQWQRGRVRVDIYAICLFG